MSKTSDAMISDLVGTFTDPIIVYPGGWGDTLPDWLKEAITLERLETNIKASKGEEPAGTDAEVCAYLYTAGLTAPMDHDWSQIYLYVAGETYTRWRKGEMPNDIRVDSLTEQQLVDLNRLKEWLYLRRTTARREIRKTEKLHQKEVQEAKVKAEQQALFEF